MEINALKQAFENSQQATHRSFFNYNKDVNFDKEGLTPICS